MSAQAGGRKRARTDLERDGAPAEADAATASTEQEEREAEFEEVEAYLAAVRAEEREAELEALEAELAAARANIKKKQSFVDYAEANLDLTADLLERMKEEIGNLRHAAGKTSTRIRLVRRQSPTLAASELRDLAEGKLQHWFDKLYTKYSSAAKVLYLAQPQTSPEGFDDLDRYAMMPLLLSSAAFSLGAVLYAKPIITPLAMVCLVCYKYVKKPFGWGIRQVYGKTQQCTYHFPSHRLIVNG